MKDEKELTSDEIRFPNSTKIYITTNGNTRNDAKAELRVPFREISLSPTRDVNDQLEKNAPIRVYDTSGVWTDPDSKFDIREGLPGLRRDWIVARGDVEEYEGREVLPQDDGYLTKGAEGIAARLPEGGTQNEFPGLKRAPLRARSGQVVTQMHYARKGIITPEMEYVAIRENLGRKVAFEQLQGAMDGISDEIQNPKSKIATRFIISTKASRSAHRSPDS